MLNFAEQTGSGAVNLVWSYLKEVETIWVAELRLGQNGDGEGVEEGGEGGETGR